MYRSLPQETGSYIIHKKKVFPHLESVISGRENAYEVMANVGDELDANKELEDAIALEEGDIENEEISLQAPVDNKDMISDGDGSSMNVKTYREICVENDKELFAKVRTLDRDQRTVIDMIVGFARRHEMANNQRGKNPWPEAPLMLVHGNAGTGKSHVIDVLSQLLQRTFRRAGDDPNNPYILRLAFTGNAAAIIQGQTINSTFNLRFDNFITSYNDKTRDLRRKELSNLKLIIIDEISLVRSDMLYQIHFRLGHELMQNHMIFGNVAIVLFGDLLQIKPPRGCHVFSPPKDSQSNAFHSLEPLWEKFKPIRLKTNHRQGEEGDCADLFNRIRVGSYTQQDIELLKTRVFPRDSPLIPKHALLCTGTNAIAEKYNIRELTLLTTKLFTLNAKVFYSTGKSIKCPPVEPNGLIRNTPLPLSLSVKVGARVMLTHNLSVVDSLVNGSLGEVVGYNFTDDGNDIDLIFIQFDNENSGIQQRNKYKFKKFLDAVPIGRLEFEFQMAKVKSSTKSAATGLAINFPVKLSWGMTLHKIQGHTIRKPHYLILDLECWLEAAMIYVGISRVQSLSQLFILGKLPINKMIPWPDALEELERLEGLDLAYNMEEFYEDCFVIPSLNTIDIRTHIDDIRADCFMSSANVNLFQETSLDKVCVDGRYDLPSKFVFFNCAGHRKGIASYVPSDYIHLNDICHNKYQLTTVISKTIAITNVYRSNDASKDFLTHMLNCVESVTINHLLIGDFNYCLRDQPNHPIKLKLEEIGFKLITSLLHQPPDATHIKGRIIDHAWVRFDERNNIGIERYEVKTCIYSDHDFQFVVLKYNDDTFSTSSTNPEGSSLI